LKKIEALLDETTVINFKLLWKLGFRYKSHVACTAVLFLLNILLFYFSQPKIFTSNIPVKTIIKHNVSTDLSSLVPVNEPEVINLAELNVSMSSHSFLKNYSELLQGDPAFSQLVLGAPSGSGVRVKDLLKKCAGNKDCLTLETIPYLRNSFVIEQGVSENRFSLSVHAFDLQTLQVAKKQLVAAIEKFRLETHQYQISKELSSVEKLIVENQNLLASTKGIELLDSNEKNESKIAEVKDRMRTLQAQINTSQTGLTENEARSHQNQKALSGDAKGDRLIASESLSVNKRINDLRLNIAALSVLSVENMSEKDRDIVRKLNLELSFLEKKRKEQGLDEHDERDELFIQDQHSKEKSIEFDLAVSQKKIAVLGKEFISLREELEQLMKTKVMNESLVNKAKHELEFIKNLESKRLSLKLLSSTITGDLLFEETAAPVREFHVMSFVKVALYSIFLSGFILFFSIVIRFLFDDQIYSEEDLQLYFSHLDFIGDVPSFNS